MTSVFEQASGQVFPVTLVKVQNAVVTQVKTLEGKDQYSAVQIGIGKKQKLGKALKGHMKALGNFSDLIEFRLSEVKDFSRGQTLDLGKFTVGEFVDVVGTSKGRGFAGVIKRHHFAGFPASHGHDKPRSVGSIGQRWPQHVRKGMRMAGHMGNIQTTVKNLQIVDIDVKRHILALKGAVPGHRNALVKIISTGKIKPLVKAEIIKEEKKKK